MMSRETRIPWRRVSSLTQELPPHVCDYLATVDSLRSAWEDAIQTMRPAEFEESRKRRLRRHAIETGIIERLYDVDWGATEALVADGITAEVAARHGGVSEDTLQMISTQLDAFIPTSRDSVTFVYTDDADARWPEAAEVIERTLAVSVKAFGQMLTI